MQDWFSNLQAEFANSPRILSLIESFNDAIDPTALIDLFYEKVWNIDTAEGWGLDCWGRIVGVNRVLKIPFDTSTGAFFGFREGIGGGRIDTFGAAPFVGGPQVSTNYALLDDDFRKLILVKAFANICDSSSKSINRALMLLFPGRGNAWVQDNLNMTATYRFAFALTPVELAILTQSGAIPRPAGVLIDIWNGDILMEDGASYILTEAGDQVAMET